MLVPVADNHAHMKWSSNDVMPALSACILAHTCRHNRLQASSAAAGLQSMQCCDLQGCGSGAAEAVACPRRMQDACQCSTAGASARYGMSCCRHAWNAHLTIRCATASGACCGVQGCSSGDAEAVACPCRMQDACRCSAAKPPATLASHAQACARPGMLQSSFRCVSDSVCKRASIGRISCAAGPVILAIVELGCHERHSLRQMRQLQSSCTGVRMPCACSRYSPAKPSTETGMSYEHTDVALMPEGLQGLQQPVHACVLP